MKSKIKRFIVIVIIIIQNISLTGCWNSREINSLAFITAMGFDKSETGILLTMQVLNPRAIASKRATNEATIIIYEEEGKDLFEIIRKMITGTARKYNGTHIKSIVFSEEFAKDGISDILDFFPREHQNRTDLYYFVAKGTTANNVLRTLTKSEINPSIKLSSSATASEQAWAATKSVKLIELINAIISDGNNPVLSGVEIVGDETENDNTDVLKKTQADAIRLKNMAVFKKDKFIGWLNEDESKGLNYLCGTVSSTISYVEDPSIGKITLEIVKTNVKRKAYLENEEFSVVVDIEVICNIANVKGDLDITKEKNIKTVVKFAEEKLLQICLKSLNKAQKDLGSDVFGFGDLVHRTFPKQWKTVKDNWNDEFINLPVQINTKVTIDETGTIGKSFFMKEKD